MKMEKSIIKETSDQVPSYIKLLLSQDLNVRQQSLITLSNTIAKDANSLKHVLQEGFLGPFLSLVNDSASISLLKSITLVLFEFTVHFKHVRSFDVNGGILTAIRWLLNHNHVQILENTLKVIGRLTKGADCPVKIDWGLIPKLISLLEHPQGNIKDATLRALGNIVAGNEDLAQVVLDHQVLLYLPDLMSHPDTEVRMNALAFLSNLAAGNKKQVQAVTQSKLLPTVIAAMKDHDFRVQKEAMFTIFNYTMEADADEVFELINGGVVPPVCRMLLCKDLEIMDIALSSIETMLEISSSNRRELVQIIEECGGRKEIEKLFKYKNREMSNLAEKIIQKYFY